MPSEEVSDLNGRVTRLETLVGDHADEGLRAEIRTLRETVRMMELRIYAAMGGGSVLYFLLSRIWPGK